MMARVTILKFKIVKHTCSLEGSLMQLWFHCPSEKIDNHYTASLYVLTPAVNTIIIVVVVVVVVIIIIIIIIVVVIVIIIVIIIIVITIVIIVIVVVVIIIIIIINNIKVILMPRRLQTLSVSIKTPNNAVNA